MTKEEPLLINAQPIVLGEFKSDMDRGDIPNVRNVTNVTNVTNVQQNNNSTINSHRTEDDCCSDCCRDCCSCDDDTYLCLLCCICLQMNN